MTELDTLLKMNFRTSDLKIVYQMNKNDLNQSKKVF